MQKISLTKWKLCGFWPYAPLLGNSIETGAELTGVTNQLDATVPGSVYMDLLRAGLIEDPYVGTNSLLCEWVANRWWAYTTTFSTPKTDQNEQVWLVFEGIDYKAHIYLNGNKIAVHEGMYTPCRIHITAHLRHDGTDNLLRVLLEHAPDEMGQIGYTSKTHTQKARFGYGWDFSTRLVNLGLYDAAYLAVTGQATLEHTHIRYQDGKVLVAACVAGEGRMEAELRDDTGHFVAAAQVDVSGGKAQAVLPVAQPKLWYPNGYGEQPLYHLHLTLLANHTVSDERHFEVGLRTLSYLPCDDAPSDSLPYSVVVNGKRIYLKGVNITPLDHLYGCVPESRYEQMILLARDAHVNLIRVWGGGLIEKEVFYRLCDRYGILVWQEFIQSSSGLDNIPSKRPEFLQLAAKTARAAVLEKRNHVCLTFWSGGNELFADDIHPATFADENLTMLRDIATSLDPDRLMLPTSASGPTSAPDQVHPENNRDVHGPWKYQGVREQYTLYNNCLMQLHSEFGTDGMANLETIAKIMPLAGRCTHEILNSPAWKHHASWWDTYEDREKPLFGEIFELDELVMLSQYLQGEGIRYALEAHRRDAFRNCGSIVWQLDEPWPNTTCTNLVDYYMQPKLAYYFYRDAMKPQHISLGYDALTYRTGDMFDGLVFAHDDLQAGWDTILVHLLDESGRVEAVWEKARNFRFSWRVPAGGRSFTVECKLLQNGKAVDVSRYLFFVLDDDHPFADRTAVSKYLQQYDCADWMTRLQAAQAALCP